jgi:hypothetical protein
VTEPEIRCAIVWSDVDLLEIETQVQFDQWAGIERAYTTRESLAQFADALESVYNGAKEALFEAGQPDLSWIELRVFEHGGARHLGLHVNIGRPPTAIINRPNSEAVLRIAVPIERGQLGAFAAGLREIGTAKRGEARLPLTPNW